MAVFLFGFGLLAIVLGGFAFGDKKYFRGLFVYALGLWMIDSGFDVLWPVPGVLV